MTDLPKLDLNDYSLREIAECYIWADNYLRSPNATNNKLLSRYLSGTREYMYQFGIYKFGPYKFVDEVAFVNSII